MGAVMIVLGEAVRAAKALAGRIVPVLALAALVIGATMAWSTVATGAPGEGRIAGTAAPSAGRQPLAAAQFRFSRVDGAGTPGTFSGCGRLVVRYEPAGAPYDALPDITRAVAELANGMGRAVGVGGPSEQAHIEVAWVADLGADAVGQAEVSWRGSRLVAARVALAAGSGLEPGFTSGRSWGPVLLHELGHAVGLSHVDDPGEVMFPVVRAEGPAAFGPGDRAGLGLLSSCRRPSTTTSQ
ncbi:MAG: matrixin family metalloprotease, partial [Acidimicrobiales bacterium]